MDREQLLKLIKEDDLELLKLPPKPEAALTGDERQITKFLEINQFVTEHNREPSPSKDMHEHQLYARLDGIRQDKLKSEALLKYDEHGLLQKEIKELKSLKDIYEDDDLNILESHAEDIFDLKHLSSDNYKTTPDYIASRKPCLDFEKFEDKFKQCQAELSSGNRKLCAFKQEYSIDKHQFFVLNGILLYVAEVGDVEVSGSRKNVRLRCIFENGLESDLLLRSLARMLYTDGRRVTEYKGHLVQNLDKITPQDKASGYVYVLKSLSTKPEIHSIKNLYKIGFSMVPVEERIKNAEKEPTYLMAPVSIIAVYQCYNINPQKFEQLLHAFFGPVCLNVDVFDEAGQRHLPREWFVVPIEIIEQAINLLLKGDIVYFRYDVEKQIIVPKKANAD